MSVNSRIRSLLRPITPVRRKVDWAIAIYSGPDPFHLAPAPHARCPALTHSDVTDTAALFVADPFMVHEGGAWYMFVEILNARTGKGEIALATSSNGLEWRYNQIVLAEPFHLSYPHVFKWEDSFYMLVESRSDSVRLYQATDFPSRWVHAKTLLEGADFRDASLLRHDGLWWMFACPSSKDDTLCLYYAEDLLGPWRPHPSNPIVSGDGRIARPGGRMIVWNGRIFRFAQDGVRYYGHRVWALEVTKLTPSCYHERMALERPLLEPSGTKWNAKGMHHVDMHQLGPDRWIACVDGFKIGHYLNRYRRL
jgi:hypothetical protein